MVNNNPNLKLPTKIIPDKSDLNNHENQNLSENVKYLYNIKVDEDNVRKTNFRFDNVYFNDDIDLMQEDFMDNDFKQKENKAAIITVKKLIKF